MYDKSKRVECKDLTVGALMVFLNGLNPDTKVLFNGDNYGYLHFEEDGSVVSFDDNSLDEIYDCIHTTVDYGKEHPEWAEKIQKMAEESKRRIDICE